MRPSIVAGDILILDRPEFSLIREGDIIAYRSITTNSIVVHRVVDVNAQGYLVTKGDNSSSNSIDEIVYMDNYLGRVVHIIPKVGIIILLAKNPLVLIIIAVSITLASLFILLDKRQGFKDRSIRIDR
jgi:signal peptidase I